MARLSLADARNLMLKGRPWTFRLEYQGTNPNNQSGWSTKFWLATGRGQSEPVEIHYGMIGNKPQVIVKDWAYTETKATEKVAKGYFYADTPFVRVRQTTIDAATHPGSLGVAAAPGFPKLNPPAPKPTPKPLPPQVMAAIVQATQGISPGAFVGLTGPYAKIVTVQPVSGNIWRALDSAGNKVMDVTAKGARDLVASYAHITVAGL